MVSNRHLPVKSYYRGKLLLSRPWIVYRVMRAIFRVVHSLLHRMGAQQAELTSYIYRAQAKY